MARWIASAKWAAGPALDRRRDMPLALRLSEWLGLAAKLFRPREPRLDTSNLRGTAIKVVCNFVDVDFSRFNDSTDGFSFIDRKFP